MPKNPVERVVARKIEEDAEGKEEEWMEGTRHPGMAGSTTSFLRSCRTVIVGLAFVVLFRESAVPKSQEIDTDWMRKASLYTF